MGSKNCAETPRQKMIGMMYLFLTAMLALNVSSEVLNGFTKVDESLRESAENLEERNQRIYDEFRFKEEISAAKVKSWRESAEKVGLVADSLFEVIEDYKYDIVRDVDGPEGNPDSINAKDNLDGPSRVMLSRGRNSKGAQLKKGINDYREELIDIMTEAVKINGGSLDSQFVASLTETLSTPKSVGHDGEPVNWEESYFSWLPTAASIALLTKLQNDVRDAESQVISYLLQQIDAKDFKVNKIEAHIIPKSTSVIRGGTFSAKILLAGTDTTKGPVYNITEDGSRIRVDSKGTFEKECNSTGVYTIGGKVILEDNEGNEMDYFIPDLQYEVIDPFATVSATKMNVLYAGVDNPVSISVPGVGANDIRATSTNGTLKKAADGQSYIAIPKDIGVDAVIKVSAMMEGKSEPTPIANYPFRVKMLPDPLPFIAYEDVSVGTDGQIKRISKTTNESNIDFRFLKYFKSITAELPGSDFEVNYDVLSFRILMINDNGNVRAEPTTGAQFNAATMEFLKEFKGTITISEVKAVGPDGITRNLPAIVSQVK